MVFVPFISRRERRKLERRKGGGGGGRGGGGGGAGRGSSGGSAGGGGRGGRSTSINTGAGTKSSSTYSNGGGTPAALPAGSPFAGRMAGGGTRGDVYGTRQYGSGYPGVAGRGVNGRGFPFFFWPVAWVGTGVGASYLYTSQYGHARDGRRPGGQQYRAAFESGSTDSTFRFLADKDSVEAIAEVVKEECGSMLKDDDDIPIDEYDGAEEEPPRPEEVVQYYRASSAALTLDGYNNTAVFEEEGAEDVPLPSGIDSGLLACLNETIGEAVPLVDGAVSIGTPSNIGIFGLAGLIYLASQF